MRQIIKRNLQVIKKFYSSKLNTSNYEMNSIKNELKEWIDDSFSGNEDRRRGRCLFVG